jgi:hypothetical protein
VDVRIEPLLLPTRNFRPITAIRGLEHLLPPPVRGHATRRWRARRHAPAAIGATVHGASPLIRALPPHGHTNHLVPPPIVSSSSESNQAPQRRHAANMAHISAGGPLQQGSHWIFNNPSVFFYQNPEI